jgi:hypothetical protein
MLHEAALPVHSAIPLDAGLSVGVRQDHLEAVAALIEPVVLVELMRIIARHAGIQDDGLAAPLLRQLHSVVHHLAAVSLVALSRYRDEAGYVARQSAHPERGEVVAVAESRIFAVVHEEQGS